MVDFPSSDDQLDSPAPETPTTHIRPNAAQQELIRKQFGKAKQQINEARIKDQIAIEKRHQKEKEDKDKEKAKRLADRVKATAELQKKFDDEKKKLDDDLVKARESIKQRMNDRVQAPDAAGARQQKQANARGDKLFRETQKYYRSLFSLQWQHETRVLAVREKFELVEQHLIEEYQEKVWARDYSEVEALSRLQYINIDNQEQAALQGNMFDPTTIEKSVTYTQHEQDRKDWEQGWYDYLNDRQKLKEQRDNEIEQIDKIFEGKTKDIYQQRPRKPNHSLKVDKQDVVEDIAIDSYIEMINQNEGVERIHNATIKHVKSVHAYIKKRIGLLPWIEEVIIGQVTKVNPATHRCTVSIGTSQGSGTVSNVMFGKAAPKVNKSYPVHFPGTYRDNETNISPGLPWIKVPGGSRWLYRKVQGEGQMQRWAWPPPEVGSDWTPEDVQGVSGNTQLLGGYQEAGKPVQIVLVEQIGISAEVEGSQGKEHWSTAREVSHYPNMGFDTLSRKWTPSPLGTWIMASANDSETFAGRYFTDIVITLQGLRYDAAIFEVDAHDTCCLPFPFQVIDQDGNDATPQGPFCADNWRYKPVMHEYMNPPTDNVFPHAVKGMKGTPSVLSAAIELTHDYDIISPGKAFFTVNYYETIVSGGCEWFYVVIFPVSVNWVSKTRIQRSYQSYYQVAEDVRSSGRYSNYSDLRLSACWGDAAAYLYFNRESYHVGPTPTDYAERDPKWWLDGTLGKFDITPPNDMGIGAAAIALLTNDSGGSSPVIFAFMANRTDSGWFRWAGSWVKLPGITNIAAVSRDGQDLFGAKGSGPVCSFDSGQTWTPCAGSDALNIGFHQGVEFIDEL